MAYNVGLTGPYPFDADIKPSLFAAAVNFYPNRTPLVSRLPNYPTNANVIKAVDDKYRASKTTINQANGITNSDTSVILTDATFLTVGDVLNLGTEAVQVTAVDATNNTVTITRGYGGSTAAAHANSLATYLIATAATGADVDLSANQRQFDTTLTYPQTVQHAYQIGGSLEGKSGNAAIPMGMSSFVSYQVAKATMEVLDDFERSIYYGVPQAISSNTARPMMCGIANRLTTNKTTSPTNASAYKPSDLERDLFQTAYAGGGQPDLMVCSTDFRQGFTVWGVNLLLLRPGDTAFGIDIEVWQSPVVNAKIIFAPLLRSGTAFCLTSEEIYMAWAREVFDKPRGSRGDAFEGDIIGEGSVVLNNEAHHAWVEGVTGFAKQS
jgi:hypothetical protein